MSTALVEMPGTLRPMLRLALPVLAEQLLATLISLTDTYLAGQYLDQPHLAAMNLMAYVLWLLPTLFTVVSIGATAMVARFVGAGDHGAARQVTNQAFLVGSLLALIVTSLGLLWGDRLVLAMRLEGQAALLATRYLAIVLPIIPAMMLLQVGIACLRGAGQMAAGLAVMIVVNIVDVTLSTSLVLGLGPFPRLGWEGLAIGTSCGYAAGGLLVLALLMRSVTGLQLQARLLKPDWNLIRRLLRIGVPGATDLLLGIACQLWYVRMINELGTLAAAAHGIAIKIEAIAYLPGIAFQVAASTLTGQYLGARDPRRASRAVWTACLAGGGLMTATGIAFFTCAEPLARQFLSHEQADVAAVTAQLLRIVSVSMPTLAITMVLSGALRGAGDTRWPLLFTLLGFLAVRIPATYLLTAAGYGVQGAWFAMGADIAVRFLLVTSRFVQGGWKRVEV